MANISISGTKGTGSPSFTFKVNPESISWSYELKTHVDETYGGRVVQVLSRKMNKLTMNGYIPNHDQNSLPSDHPVLYDDTSIEWVNRETDGSMAQGRRATKFFKAMEDFERQMTMLMDDQYEVGDDKQTVSHPLKVVYDPLGIDCEAFLVGYGDVRYDVDSACARYSLEFTPVNASVNLSKIDDPGLFSDVIKGGVNWVRNEFNNPMAEGNMNWETAKKTLTDMLNKAGTSFQPPSLYAEAESSGGGEAQYTATQQKVLELLGELDLSEFKEKEEKKLVANVLAAMGYTKGSSRYKKASAALKQLEEEGSVVISTEGGYYSVSTGEVQKDISEVEGAVASSAGNIASSGILKVADSLFGGFWE